MDLGSLNMYVLLREVLFSPCLPLTSPNSNCVLLVAPTQADLPHEAQV